MATIHEQPNFRKLRRYLWLSPVLSALWFCCVPMVWIIVILRIWMGELPDEAYAFILAPCSAGGVLLGLMALALRARLRSKRWLHQIAVGEAIVMLWFAAMQSALAGWGVLNIMPGMNAPNVAPLLLSPRFLFVIWALSTVTLALLARLVQGPSRPSR